MSSVGEASSTYTMFLCVGHGPRRIKEVRVKAIELKRILEDVPDDVDVVVCVYDRALDDPEGEEVVGYAPAVHADVDHSEQDPEPVFAINAVMHTGKTI